MTKTSTSIYLPPIIKEYLLLICKKTGESQSELIKRLLIEEYTHLKLKDKAK